MGHERNTFSYSIITTSTSGLKSLIVLAALNPPQPPPITTTLPGDFALKFAIFVKGNNPENAAE